MSLPNFLILGAPKSGTSSLYEYLRKHPDIFLPERKELHFFSREIITGQVEGPGDKSNLKDVCRSRAEYEKLFSGAHDGGVVCELSTSYLYQIREYMPEIKEVLGSDLRIIVLLRHPVRRAYSNYQHQKRNGVEKETFERALELEEVRKLEGWGTFWRYKDQSFYYQNLHLLDQAFGKERLLILTQEELDKDAVGTLGKIYRFMNIRDTFVPDNISVEYNRSGVYKRKALVDWMMQPSGLRKTIKSFMPTGALDQLRKKRDAFISTNTVKVERINPSTELMLEQAFRTDLQLIKEEFGCSFDQEQ